MNASDPNPGQYSGAAALRAARASSRPGRRLWWGALVAVLIGIVGYSLLHEARKQDLPAATPDSPLSDGHIGHEMGHVERPPMSADEERFAHALWRVHDEVRSAAVKMSFAGLAYKMGDSDKAAMRAKVQPLVATFDDARAKIEALPVPDTLSALRADYLKAVALYHRAARLMLAGGKDDAHLLEAHGSSEQASTLLLKVGDTLWPGEYKPN